MLGQPWVPTARWQAKPWRRPNIRSRTGASVVAFIRDRKLTANPKSMTVFQAGDRIGLIGEQDQIEAARDLVAGPPEVMPPLSEQLVTE